MASYPGSIPSLATVSSANTITAAHVNDPNREIEAICTELGARPSQILDTASVSSSPADVGKYLSMVATILRTIAGIPSLVSVVSQNSGWWRAAQPSRFFVWGNMQNTTFAPGVDNYAYPFGGGVTTTEADAQIVVPFDMLLDNLWVDMTTAMPTGASDFLHVAIRRNATDLSLGILFIPPGTVGTFRKQQIDFAPSGDKLAAGDKLALRIKMDSGGSGSSGQVGGWGLEGRQVG